MRIPLNWLNDYLTPPLSDTAAIASALTNAGLEVEGVSRVAPGLESVVTGKILSTERHPNADRLRICQTDVGQAEPLQIVTGAANVEAGDIIPVALVGSDLPGGLSIKASKLRGVDSFGMYCSKKELGLPPDIDGVHVFPADTPIGILASDVLGIGDVVLEIAVTANRPDALSIVGVARELAAAGLATLKAPELATLPTEPASAASVTLADAELCSRYAGQVLDGLTVGPSPEWLAKRLELAGIRSISNVVDVTNYVLLELGQPLHAFDLTKIDAATVTARRAQPGERLTTLDGEERELATDMLVIADRSAAHAVAGVMGGAVSQVTEATTAILLESAYFLPKSVRRTAKTLGLASESSYRFERGVDPEGTLKALARATALLAQVAGARPVGAPAEALKEANWPAELTVSLRPERIAKILGITLPVSEIKTLLEGLGFQTAGEGPISVKIPGWRRHDVTREADLIEEIARRYGYDRIPTTLPRLDRVGGSSPRHELETEVRSMLVGSGFDEVITPSLVNLANRQDSLGMPVVLANPLAEMTGLRQSLLPGLLEVARHNHYQGNSDLAIFEIGRTYVEPEVGPTRESQVLALFAMGEMAQGVWRRAPEALIADFYWLKGALENLFERLGLEGVLFVAAEAAEAPASLHPGRAAKLLYKGETLGYLGELHPQRYADTDLPAGGRAAVGWVDLDRILAEGKHQPHFEAFARYPAIARDLALVVAEDLPSSELVAEVKALGGALLESVVVFDRYQGPQVPQGRVSLGLSLRYREAGRTLSDADVEPIHQRIVERMAERYGAALRD
ncbi:Phenylalanine--tRNA ligase beta subunit [compost metagenome]